MTKENNHFEQMLQQLHNQTNTQKSSERTQDSLIQILSYAYKNQSDYQNNRIVDIVPKIIDVLV